MTPLILKTGAGFVSEGYETELWVPWRHNPAWRGKDPFAVHGVATRFKVRRIPTLDFIPFFHRFGFLMMVASFNLTSFCMLLFGNRERTILYAHDTRDLVLPCLLGYRAFCEIHDFYESGHGWVNRLVLARIDGLIVTNTLKMKHIEETYGFPRARMSHQPNAVDYEMFQVSLSKEEARREISLPLEKRIVLYTGHLFSWKGVDTLARAAAYLPDDVCVYFVGGTEMDRGELQAFVAEQSIPRIEFLPHQEHERMPLFMRAADVLVLPNTAREAASKYETSPVKLFEYMASGTSIVASDLPSIRDIVTEKEVAFFVPDNPESLAHTVMGTLDHLDEARVRAEAAKQRAKHLSWEARATNIADLIRTHRRVPTRSSRKT